MHGISRLLSEKSLYKILLNLEHNDMFSVQVFPIRLEVMMRLLMSQPHISK